MKKTLAKLLVFCLIVSMLAVPAMAAVTWEDNSAEAAGDETISRDFSGATYKLNAGAHKMTITGTVEAGAGLNVTYSADPDAVIFTVKGEAELTSVVGQRADASDYTVSGSVKLYAGAQITYLDNAKGELTVTAGAGAILRDPTYRNGYVTVKAISGGNSGGTGGAGTTPTNPIPTNPTNPSNKPAFTDVSTSAYYYNAVMWAIENGITQGLTSSTFGPDASCTRGQMVTFLWRLAGSPKATGTNPFGDVTADSYYYDAVMWAVANGITSGTTADAFSPDATVNRAQSVTFLYRYAGSPAVEGSNAFSDVAGSDYYANAVAWAAANGITLGTTDTTFSPDNACVRGQIVTFMYRYAVEK